MVCINLVLGVDIQIDRHGSCKNNFGWESEGEEILYKLHIGVDIKSMEGGPISKSQSDHIGQGLVYDQIQQRRNPRMGNEVKLVLWESANLVQKVEYYL